MTSNSQKDAEQEVQEKLQPLQSKSDSDAFEAVLQHVGEFGLYQKLLFLAMAPFGLVFAYVYYVQLFITATPQNHWCRVPELEHLDIGIRRNLTTVTTNEGWEKCFMYDANWTQVLQDMAVPAFTKLVPCKNGWEFELTDVPYHTVASERGWVCNNASNIPFAQSFFFLGSFLGGILFGWMADYYGRVPTMMGIYLMAIIGGVGSVYTRGLWDFAICRFLVGTAFDSCFIIMYILVLEYVGPKYRSIIGNISIAVFYGGGAISVPWLALWLSDWRKLVWVTNIPLLMILLMPFTIPESARWLSSRGQTHRAIKVLKRFERINGTKIPQEVLDDFIISSNMQKDLNETLKDAFKSPPIRKMIIFMALTSTCGSVIFDALVRLTEGLGYNFFITFSLVSATEIPSVILAAFTLDRLGRRNLTFIPVTTIGILILVAAFVPKGTPRVAVGVLARFMMNMMLTAITQWAAEIFPTAIRASGSSLMHVMSFAGIIASPFIAYSGKLWHTLPFIIVAGISFSAGVFSLQLPETKGVLMPQTIKDAEKIVRMNMLCSNRTSLDEDLPKEEPVPI